MELNLSDDLSLPLEAVTQTFADLGIRGSGKTNTAVCLAEEMLKAGQQIVALDPTDAWYGIRSSRDGKSEGFKVYVFGGEHGDLPLAGTLGEGSTMAEFLIETGASVVFSLRHLNISEQRRFAQEFAERLYDLKGKSANRTPLHIFVDEADEFVPQRIPHGFERMFGAYDRLVRRGRSSGIGMTLISQRPQVLNKDVLSQCETLICHRLLHKLDRKAIEAWIEAHDTEGQGDRFMAALASLERGTAWVWSPSWLDVFKQVRVRFRETFDSSFTPKAGEKPKTATRLAEVDLGALKDKLAATIEKVKADDPRELRKRIKELEHDIAKVATSTNTVDESVVARRIEGCVEKALAERDGEWEECMRRFKDAVMEKAQEVSSLVFTCPSPTKPYALNDKFLSSAGFKLHAPAYNVMDLKKDAVAAPKAFPPAPGNVSGLKERILSLLSEFEALGRKEVRRTVVSARAEARGGYFSRTVGEMRTGGLIEFPAPGSISMTPEGRRLAPKPDRPINNREMYESCLRNLSGLEVRIFELLYRRYPHAMSRDEVSEKVEARGGYYSRVVGHLHTMEFVEYPKPGMLKCPDWVFVES